MRDYLDKIVFYACCMVLFLMGFAGGAITVWGLILIIWRLFT